MNKPRINTRNTEATDILDWSYVELQEHDFLESQRQELSYGFTQTDVSENLSN